MVELLDNLYDTTAYLGVIPLLLGIFYWRFLNLALRIFIVGKCLWQSLTLLSIIFNYFNKSTSLLLYLNCLSSIIIYSCFFFILLKIKLARAVLVFFSISFLIFFCFELFENGIKQHFVLPYTIMDGFMLIMAIMLYRTHPHNASIRLLNISLILNFITDLAFSVITHNLFNYFQNKIYLTAFNGISPIYNLIIIGLQTYAFYIVRKQTQPNFDNNPNFK